MTSASQADAIAAQDPTAIESEKEKKKLGEKQFDIEYAKRGGDLPAVVDVHGEVIKAEANEAEEYEHSLGLWQAMKFYKKVQSSIFAVLSAFLRGAKRKPSLTQVRRPSSGRLSPRCPSSWKALTTRSLEAATLPSLSSARYVNICLLPVCALADENLSCS